LFSWEGPWCAEVAHQWDFITVAPAFLQGQIELHICSDIEIVLARCESNDRLETGAVHRAKNSGGHRLKPAAALFGALGAFPVEEDHA
jgi:hypothetical protein